MNKHLTPMDIKSLVSSGEGYNVEFKIRVPANVKKLSEEICAFANAAGGVLLIGVSDDNIIHGTSIAITFDPQRLAVFFHGCGFDGLQIESLHRSGQGFPGEPFAKQCQQALWTAGRAGQAQDDPVRGTIFRDEAQPQP